MKNIKIMTLLLAAVTVLSAASCRKMDHDVLNPNNIEGFYVDTTYAGQFRRVWQGIDVGYAFWHSDPMDWDSVYRVNLPKFEAADERVKAGQEGMSFEEYGKLWSSFIVPLLDHHLSLFLIHPEDKQYVKERLILLSPSSIRRLSADWHRRFEKEEHLNALKTMLDDFTLKAEIKVCDYPMADDSAAYMISGMIEGNIAYFYFSSFMIPYNDTKVADFVGEWISNIIGNNDLKGVILDTRNNGGGYSKWIQILGQFFCDKSFSPNYTKVKTDIGRYDFSAKIPNIVAPNGNGYCRIMSDDCPFVCLFDQHSVSNGEEIPWMFSYLPGYVGIGERTAGGMGGLTLDNYTSFFSGTFGNADLMKGKYSRGQNANYYCYMSTFSHFDSETGKCPEGIGMIPDVEVPLDTVAFFSGTSDNQLLKAVEYIKSR